MTNSDGSSDERLPQPDHLAAALVVAVSSARWPDGSLLIDLHPDIVRRLLSPRVDAALAQLEQRCRS